jgi:hypothetical protein
VPRNITPLIIAAAVTAILGCSSALDSAVAQSVGVVTEDERLVNRDEFRSSETDFRLSEREQLRRLFFEGAPGRLR